MHRTLLFALIGLSISLPARADVVSPKAVAVPNSPTSIIIDGKLNESAWRGAGRISSFIEYREGRALANQTQTMLLYDDRALYVGFRCTEADVPGIKASTTQHDGSVWEDDCVEIFLDTKGDRVGYVHFALNAKSVRYDAEGEESYAFNPAWDAKCVIGAGGWTAEIRIPFGSLGVSPPKPGDAWLGNFCREEKPSSELSCWSASHGSFNATSRFGEIVFGSLRVRARSRITATEQNLASMRETAKGTADEEQLTRAKSALDAAKSLVPASGTLTEKQYLSVAALLSQSAEAQRQVAEIIRRAAMGNPEYLVWETTPWRHFSETEDCSDVRQDTKLVPVLVLGGQTESRALMVSNLTDETLSARLLISGFPKDSVEVLIPAFVRAADGSKYPDALVPPDPIGQLIVPPGETRQIWVNVKGLTPGRYDGTITVSPLTASRTDKEAKFTVEVAKSPKPPPKPLGFTWDYLGDAEERGLEEQYVQSLLDHGTGVFLITGLRYMPRPRADDEGNFLEPTDWSRFEHEVRLKWKPGRKLYIGLDIWEKAQDRGVYNGKFDSPGWRIALKKIIVEMVSVLRKLGLSYDDFMVNPLDEGIDERYVKIARLVKEADPNVKIVEDTIGENLEQVKEADRYTDYWIPHFRAFQDERNMPSIAYMQSTGKPVGFYFYSEGANEKAQDSYGHYLWRFWYAYSKGVNGILGYWTATQHYGNPWDRHVVESAYDPSLFYCGSGCVITGRRWEAWRRGIEDFALLKLCESAGVERRILDAAVQSVLDAPKDPDAAARARERLIRALEQQSAH